MRAKIYRPSLGKAYTK